MRLEEPYRVALQQGRFLVEDISGATILICADKDSAAHYVTLLRAAYRAGVSRLDIARLVSDAKRGLTIGNLSHSYTLTLDGCKIMLPALTQLMTARQSGNELHGD